MTAIRRRVYKSDRVVQTAKALLRHEQQQSLLAADRAARRRWLARLRRFFWS